MTELYFAEPPLKEVSFSIQFDPIPNFHLGYIGTVWNLFKDNYPIVEHADEIQPVVEKFGVMQREKPKLQFLESAPMPRLIFMSKDGQHLIQLQKDRFIFNWRQQNGGKYPRYRNIKKLILDELNTFLTFLSDNDLNQPDFNQVETTYVNFIDANKYAAHEVFEDIIHESRYSPSLCLETFAIQLKHLIKNEDSNIGRLYTSINKANLLRDGSSVYELKFVARSHPLGNSLDGITKVMDIFRSTINDSFNAITTSDMHDHWNKG